MGSVCSLTLRMLPKNSPAKHIVTRLSPHLPSFTDIFDEESFYITFLLLAFGSVMAVYFLSRRVTLKDAGHID